MRPRDEDRLGRRERRARSLQARVAAAGRPLLAQWPRSQRAALGLGLLFLCLWLPAFVALFRP
jgi:hypothetical protein